MNAETADPKADRPATQSDDTPTTRGLPRLDLGPVDPETQRVCHAVNAAWYARQWRGRARSARERLEQLRAEGRVMDEEWFATHAQVAPQ